MIKKLTRTELQAYGERELIELVLELQENISSYRKPLIRLLKEMNDNRDLTEFTTWAMLGEVKEVLSYLLKG